MKTLVLHISLLIGAFLYACNVSIPKQSDSPTIPLVAQHKNVEMDAWRRTAHGWEQVTDWPAPRRSTQLPPAQYLRLARVHPLIWALLQGLISLAALVGIPPTVIRYQNCVTSV